MDYSEVKHLFEEIKGQPCCRQRTGEHRGLLLGFGKKVFHGKSNRRDTFQGEWELGTDYVPWRILVKDDIVIGSSDSSDYDTATEFDAELQKIELGSFQRIEFFDSLKIISVELEGDTKVEFIPCSKRDEWFYLFMPDYTYLEYKNSEWLLVNW